MFFEAANALAKRILAESNGDFGGRLQYAYQLALNRKPTGTEVTRLASYFDTQASLRQKEPDAIEPWVGDQPHSSESR